ncbi:MAG TPA: DUF4388 domain-containing protein [Candidatus Polarisedimenticolaceae bacterium]|nr:DUF4388 domain-containing protein [Candidatus Polarisedimenticolaceae bacterium]
MAVHGNLQTMSLGDLLQWAGQARKSGVLELERNKVTRRIVFRDGEIVGCSADDPPIRLGQFLLSRGKISADALREALARQETEKRSLGLILLELGALTQKELLQELAAKAEETIFGLFDWDDAVFRFDLQRPIDPYTIEVHFTVEDLLLRGLRRADELQQIRGLFPSSGVVLRRTATPEPPEVQSRAMAQRIFASIDGLRTVGEIVLHAHSPEFLVLKFLYTLHKRGLVEIGETRAVPPDTSTILDRTAEAATAPAELPVATPTPAAPQRAAAEEPTPGSHRQEIDVAARLLVRGEHDAALELLNACYRAHPGDEYLRQLIADAEASYLQKAHEEEFTPLTVPRLLQPTTALAGRSLSAAERFLLSLIDGKSDIRSLLWVAPLRDVELLRALRGLRDKGVIELLGAGDRVSA